MLSMLNESSDDSLTATDPFDMTLVGEKPHTSDFFKFQYDPA
jgi:hypothetical protein